MLENVIYFYSSKRESWFLFLIGLGFVVMELFILNNKSTNASDWQFWLGLILFGACMLLGLYRLVYNKPVIEINEKGITMLQTRKPFKILWEDMVGAELTSISTGHSTIHYLIFEMRPFYFQDIDKTKMDKLGRKTSAVFFGEDVLPVPIITRTAVKKEKILELIKSLIENKSRIKETISLHNQLQNQ
jgi:hypothetical protein